MIDNLAPLVQLIDCTSLNTPSNSAANPSSSQVCDYIAFLPLDILLAVIRACPNPRWAKPIAAWLPAPHAC
jgi:hypothetical protein